MSRSLAISSLAFAFATSPIACDVKVTTSSSSSSKAASSSTAKPAASSSAGAAEKKKPVTKRPDNAQKDAVKKPESDKDKPISTDAGKVDQNILDAKGKKKREDAPADQCKGAPDGAGICAGNLMAFCVGEQPYLLDCNQYEIDNGFESGTCIQAGNKPDCYGSTPTVEPETPNYSVYCDPADNRCCDSEGYCWTDASAGDDVPPDPED